jgi:hypothetical protein
MFAHQIFSGSYLHRAASPGAGSFFFSSLVAPPVRFGVGAATEQNSGAGKRNARQSCLVFFRPT